MESRASLKFEEGMIGQWICMGRIWWTRLHSPRTLISLSMSTWTTHQRSYRPSSFTNSSCTCNNRSFFFNSSSWSTLNLQTVAPLSWSHRWASPIRPLMSTGRSNRRTRTSQRGLLRHLKLSINNQIINNNPISNSNSTTSPTWVIAQSISPTLWRTTNSCSRLFSLSNSEA